MTYGVASVYVNWYNYVQENSCFLVYDVQILWTTKSTHKYNVSSSFQALLD